MTRYYDPILGYYRRVDEPDTEGNLVCHDPKCRGANLCEKCRKLLDRYGEPGRA